MKRSELTAGGLTGSVWGRALMAALLITPGLVLIIGLWVRYG